MITDQPSGSLYVVATPIGNLKDITLRAIEILKSVDLILCEDTRMSKKLLNHYQINAKTESYHAHNETNKAAKVIDQILAGKNMALISDAGTPAINDPGAILVNQAHQRNIKVFAIGGISALSAALSISGIEGDFLFKGFVPQKKHQRKEFITTLMAQSISSLFFVGASKIKSTLENIVAINGNQKLILIKEISKIYETSIKSSATDIEKWLLADENHQRGEFVLVIEKSTQDLDQKQQQEKLKKVLRVLQSEGISVSQSAKIASKITGLGKNTCYQLSQTLGEKRHCNEN